MKAITSIIHDFSHLFFPHTCAGCHTDNLARAVPVCLHCMIDLPVTNFYDYADNPIEKYLWGRLPILAAASLYHFSNDSLVQTLLHELKYRGNKAVGYFLGKKMGEAMRNTNRFNDINLIIPLPLFPRRLKERGYNQSAVIGEGISSVLGVPILNTAVTRMTATDTQTHKNRAERWINMDGKFAVADPLALSQKHILLVDDVITTGATLEACGQRILQAPDVKLSIATLAYTV